MPDRPTRPAREGPRAAPAYDPPIEEAYELAAWQPGAETSLAQVRQSFESYSAANAWLTAQQTLTENALGSILAGCANLELHPRACAPEVLAGTPPFGAIPEDARREANLLLRACESSAALEPCRTDIEDLRFVRDQSVGRIEPRPTSMVEDVAETFTAFIRRTTIVHVPGVAGIPDPAAGDNGGAQGASQGDGTLVEFTRETCFEIDGGAEFEVVGEATQCPDYLRSGQYAFAPEWTVIPRVPGEGKRLKLYRIIKRDGRVIERVPQDPYPVRIDVAPAPSLASKVKAWLTEWTGVTGALTDFVVALEALIAAIAGLSIWRWLRGRKKKDTAEADGPAKSG